MEGEPVEKPISPQKSLPTITTPPELKERPGKRDQNLSRLRTFSPSTSPEDDEIVVLKRNTNRKNSTTPQNGSPSKQSPHSVPASEATSSLSTDDVFNQKKERVIQFMHERIQKIIVDLKLVKNRLSLVKHKDELVSFVKIIKDVKKIMNEIVGIISIPAPVINLTGQSTGDIIQHTLNFLNIQIDSFITQLDEAQDKINPNLALSILVKIGPMFKTLAEILYEFLLS